jgi:plasmid stabilization system protein ParE
MAVYSYSFRDTALEDLNPIIAYYEAIGQELCDRFLHELRLEVESICSYPKARALTYKQFRSVVLPTFPFLLYYTIHQYHISIHSVYHAHANPKRIKKALRKKK